MIMKHIATITLILGLLPVAAAAQTPVPKPGEVAQWQDLFNGKDLTGWVNVNTAEDTWKVRDGMLICSGHPIGVMRSEQAVRELRAAHRVDAHGGRAATPACSCGATRSPDPRDRLPNGVEVQMLELDWPKLNTRERRHAAGRLRPRRAVRRRRRQDHARQSARRAQHVDREPRARASGEWNTYDVVAVDGVDQARRSTASSSTASRRSTQKKGYFCLESEGGEIHFRNMRVLELPPGVTTPEQTAPERK